MINSWHRLQLSQSLLSPVCGRFLDCGTGCKNYPSAPFITSSEAIKWRLASVCGQVDNRSLFRRQIFVAKSRPSLCSRDGSQWSRCIQMFVPETDLNGQVVSRGLFQRQISMVKSRGLSRACPEVCSGDRSPWLNRYQ